ncbi:MAG TPA: UPF0236 family protein, partial [Virgibacillus sp.]|nr:UPF0236 family protein [Virgibacillus sp.]
MNNDINNLPNLKEIESNLFSELQDVFQSTLLSVLHEIDVWLRDSRDFERFENREMQKTTLATMVGPITINRRIYRDRDARDRFCDLLRYQVTSHETIRQEVLKINPKEIEPEESAPKREKDVLFLEVDGLNVHKQNSTRKSREIKFGIV